MSAFQFYKTLGQQQFFAHKDVSNTGSVIVKTPYASTRLVITGLTVSTNLGGTIAFFFGGANQTKLAEFIMAGSVTISPAIGGWESTAQDAPFYVNTSGGSVNGWKITAEGFELDL